MVPQDPRQAGHMPETEPEMSHLERQPMLKNLPQVQDKEGGMLTRVEQRSSGPTGDSGEGGATGSKTGGSYTGDRIGDESFREAADVEESFTSSG